MANLYGYASDSDNDRYYLLLEYCNSDLQKLIDSIKLVNKSGIFPEEQARKIVDHLFKAQYDLSLRKIIHRDLKPANIGIHFDGLSSSASFD